MHFQIRKQAKLSKTRSQLYQQLSRRPKAHFLAFRKLYTQNTNETCEPLIFKHFSTPEVETRAVRLASPRAIALLRLPVLESLLLLLLLLLLHSTPNDLPEALEAHQTIQNEILDRLLPSKNFCKKSKIFNIPLISFFETWGNRERRVRGSEEEIRCW